jgi:hypothetical protein
VVGEGAEICGEHSSLEHTQVQREDVHELDEELFVIEHELGPPMGLHRREVGKGYEVIELRVQRWVGQGVRWAWKVRGGGRSPFPGRHKEPIEYPVAKCAQPTIVAASDDSDIRTTRATKEAKCGASATP